MKIPGVLYSLLVAIGAWAIDYLTTGGGAGIPWAPIVIAAVPVIIKLFAVQTEKPAAMSRSMGSAESSKVKRLLLG